METIGKRLKKVREERGITLEKAQADTRIHTKILRALEEDKVSGSASEAGLLLLLPCRSGTATRATSRCLERWSRL